MSILFVISSITESMSNCATKIEILLPQSAEVKRLWNKCKWVDLSGGKNCIETHFWHLISLTLHRWQALVDFYQEKLDEKKDIVAKLSFQLEAALADARRQAESQREKNIAKVCSNLHSLYTNTG